MNWSCSFNTKTT